MADGKYADPTVLLSVDVTKVDRAALEAACLDYARQVQRATLHAAEAANTIDNLRATIRHHERHVTDMQQRGNQLLADARASKALVEGLQVALDMHPLAPLLRALKAAREKHPGGPDGLRSLMEEVGEVANAIRRETPERVREELLDVAVVALRWYLGETPVHAPGPKLACWTCSHCGTTMAPTQSTTSCASCGRPR